MLVFSLFFFFSFLLCCFCVVVAAVPALVWLFLCAAASWTYVVEGCNAERVNDWEICLCGGGGGPTKRENYRGIRGTEHCRVVLLLVL